MFIVIAHAALFINTHLHYYTDVPLGSPYPSRNKRVRVTVPEQELRIRCYEVKGGQSLEEVLEHVRGNIGSLPFNHPVVEFYIKQDDQPAIKRVYTTYTS